MQGVRIFLCCFYTLVIFTCTGALAQKYALLVGISDYKSVNIKDLEGPKYDVDSLQTILPAWGISRANTQVLVDAQATKQNIIKALQRLEQNTRSGDQLFIYFSGHGTSPFDDQLGLDMAHTTGAFLPFDSLFSEKVSRAQLLNSLIVGQRDLQPWLKKMDKDRQVFVVIDACFSENTARSISNDFQKPQPRAQSLPYAMLTSAVKTTNTKKANTGQFGEAYPYDNVVFFSASAKHERAGDYNRQMDLSRLTLDGKPHGVFTDALLRVLTGMIAVDNNGDKQLSYLESYQAASNYLSDAAQTPKMSHKKGSKVIERAVFATEAPHLIQQVVSPSNQNIQPLHVYIKQPRAQAQVKSVLGDVAGLLVTQDQKMADLLVLQNGYGIDVVNKLGEKIKTFAVLNNHKIYSYFKSQHWLKNMRHLKAAGRSSLLIDFFDGANIGSTVRIGDKFDLNITTDKAASLWLMVMNSDGGVDVLHPRDNEENKPVSSGAQAVMPLLAKAPLGEDWLIALAFSEPIKALDKFIGASFSGAGASAEQFYSIIASYQSQMAKHEKRLITVEKAHSR